MVGIIACSHESVAREIRLTQSDKGSYKIVLSEIDMSGYRFDSLLFMDGWRDSGAAVKAAFLIYERQPELFSPLSFIATANEHTKIYYLRNF